MKILMFMRVVGVVLAVAALSGCASSASREVCLVADGQPRAEIVISTHPARMTKLAAEELQTYLKKMTGATLPITHTPAREMPVQIYVGESPYTERLNVSAEGLKYGAFRMVAGKNWLALVGNDKDFVPKPMYATNVSDRARVRATWDELTGGQWVESVGDNVDRGYHTETGWWKFDRRGSLNAVYAFLRGLGVHWYMAGELGEIVPTMSSVRLSAVDKTVRPDYAMRSISFTHRYDWATKEELLWYYRLGLNYGDELMGHGPRGHGIVNVYSRDVVKTEHPEYFAIWDGKRATNYMGCGAPCLSSEGLFQSNVGYVRAIFDIYGEPMVSVMPCDNYEQPCECTLCKGKATLGRGDSRWGDLSDYVWDYVNRVAKETYKTNPDQEIICFAYDDHVLPPLKLDQLSPNLVVGIVQHTMRSTMHHPGPHPRGYPDMAELLRAWQAKQPFKKLITWDYYLYSDPRKDRWFGVPVFFPHSIADNLRILKSVPATVWGDFAEVTVNMPGKWELPEGREWGPQYTMHAPGFNHLNVYVTARLYWDVNQDVDELLNEYYTNYYGPAAEEMKTFIEFSEANWPKMSDRGPDVACVRKALDLLAAARKVAGDSVYGQRIALVADYTRPLEDLLVRERERAEETRIKVQVPDRSNQEITLDGQLDDPFWAGLKPYRMKENATGRKPAMETTFKAGWADDALYFGIRCDEPDMAGLNVTATENDDMAIYKGDDVELLLQTPAHAYYQLTVNPAGALTDLDRKGGIEARWASRARVAAHRGDGFWSVELRIPVRVGVGAVDVANPLSGLAGGKPTVAAPWCFNLGRQRIRGGTNELFAFSPGGASGFHALHGFAELTVR